MSSIGFRPSIQVRVMMLIASYAPLLALLAALGTWQSWWVRGMLLGCASFGPLLVYAFFRQVRKRNQLPHTIYQVKPREGEALKFFASYVIPFFVTVTAPPDARWGLIVYLIVLASLYIQGDLYFTNPVIALFGYRIFELTAEDRSFRLVISRQWYLTPQTTLSLVSLGGYVYFDCWKRK